MPSKRFNLVRIGDVTVVKRRGNRNMRLSFDPNGQPRVSIPMYTPYRTGLAFAKGRRDWIAKHRPPGLALLANGQVIANNYHLRFKPGAAKIAAARVKANEIIINYPDSLTASDDKVQAAARRGALRAIRKEAENILPPRLAELAGTYNLNYKLVRIKPMRRRWGSCDQAGNITLNSYLVTLAPELIDYVLTHELVHTIHQHHQSAFWQAMDSLLPDTKALRKRARAARAGL